MKRIMLAIVFAALIGFAGCGYMVDEDQAVRAVTNLGFTDVTVEDRSVFFMEWRGCSKSDDAVFIVHGKNQQGNRVKLLVCVGWPFKGATIRSM